MHQTPLFTDADSAGIGVIARLGTKLQSTSNSIADRLGLESWEVPPSGELGKRVVDVCMSLWLLIVLSPVITLIIVVNWYEGDGPLLYISERIGRYGRPFVMYKFRSMVVDAETLKPGLKKLNGRRAVLFKISNDPRVTRIGRFLRKYSLDEIPQLINVLLGEMSLVGPRPPLASEVEQYDPQHFVRFRVLPGLTGLWQTQARKSPDFHDYIQLDIQYVQHRSFWLDFTILCRTIAVVISGTGE